MLKIAIRLKAGLQSYSSLDFNTLKSILTDATEGIQMINTSSSVVTRVTKTLIHFNLTVITWKQVKDFLY